MSGWRELGVAGTALALTGGVAYVLWNFRDRAKSRDAEKVTYKRNSDPKKQEKLVAKETRTETAREAAAHSSQIPEGDLNLPNAVTNEAGHLGNQRRPRRWKLLVLGLDGAGKTSLLQRFVTGNTEQEVAPTQGVHAVSINKENLQIEFLEIGGEEKLREYWRMYLEKARVLVFVLDAADSTRFPQAKTSLHQLLASDPYLPLVLLANKQDLPGACGVTEVYESMALGSVGDGRKLCVLGTQVQKGSSDAHPSVQGAYELILEMMNCNSVE